jgi:glycosyltransferase involved in cell wall biosynthesis
MRREFRILHVVEALGGGIAVALSDYIASSPEFEHYVLGYRRPGAETGVDLSVDATVLVLPGGIVRQTRAIRAWMTRLKPDLVHVHSSKAGACVRLLPRKAKPPTVYTPHCFAFERKDVSPAARTAFRAVERFLAARTDAFCAVSPREAELARELGRGAAVSYIPNIARIPRAIQERREHRARGTRRPMVIATVGRVCAQKGPDFFAEAAALAGEQIAGMTSWVWIGGGDPEREAILRGAGVTVTGWCNRESALSALADADVYVHTAEWEGAPLTLLEASALGIPVVARSLPALQSLGVERLAHDPRAAVYRIRELLDERAWLDASVESRIRSERHTPQHQAHALQRLYLECLVRAEARSRTVGEIPSIGAVASS